MSIILLLMFMVQTNCELTESVIFQPIDKKYKQAKVLGSSPLLLTSLLINSFFDYGKYVTETMIEFKTTFHKQHPR